MLQMGRPKKTRSGTLSRQDVKTKKCTVMDKKPAATEYTTVGDDGVV